MIPYFPQPALHFGSLTIHAFSVLAAVAVVAGCWMVVRRGYRSGLPAEEMFQFWFWMYAAAIAGVFLYSGTPHAGGVSAAGAIGGGAVGAIVWCRVRRLSWPEVLRRLDIAAYALPFAGTFARLGCALAHDHRGLPSDSWLAVQFPNGPRYDLGLIEFLFLATLAALFHLLGRRPRAAGFFFGFSGVAYGGFRLWLDTLRVSGRSPASGIAMVMAGLAGWAAMWALHLGGLTKAKT